MLVDLILPRVVAGRSSNHHTVQPSANAAASSSSSGPVHIIVPQPHSTNDRCTRARVKLQCSANQGYACKCVVFSLLSI